MNTSSSSSSLDKPSRPVFPLPWLVVLLAMMALVMFIAATPGGLLTKADMVGYAVCHRIGSHSFAIGGRQLPLCARCTGTFIGALVGFLGQAVVLRRRRASEFPPAFIIVLLVIFTLLWASDGLNSYVQLIGGPHLYEPRNWLRLTTGALNGLTMSALVYPVFNFTLWRRPVPERAIRGLRDLGVLVLLEAGLVGLTLTGWSFLLYPLALLSALGVLTLLTSVTSMLLVMLVRRDNMVETWREAIIPLLAGLTVALIQVGVIDGVRYALTGTLTGIPPLR
ncbi:MAG: hypothetical protein DRJ03_14425 [Chloroflexi bacterium]|nr:MAG: hypothetical protein B6I35_08930 [Anaerolineaceae bacterium 4572_32.2]RLC78525.1 MAG: hypothetical protein DRI81_06525 [Chloroflexota bacterium]RLC84367.1 MAG: hypothetical protein DRJ03_14425 [Chloroflexota bacterium]HEY71994.1 DUF2085 domain-containing protein [Thermoflexia bacterium]